MELAARTAVWKKTGGTGPYDAEVECLISSGNQYIDTGFFPDDNSGFEIDVVPNFEMSGTSHIPFGVRLTSGNTRWFVNFGNDLQVNWGANRHIKKFNSGARYSISLNFLNSRKATVDGVNYYNVSGTIGSSNYSATIFCLNNYGEISNFFMGEVFRCRISGSDKVVSDLIPVRFTNENGVSEGAMYDRIHGQLFRNAGNGAFIIGPDKNSSLMEIIQV